MRIGTVFKSQRPNKTKPAKAGFVNINKSIKQEQDYRKASNPFSGLAG